MCSRHPEMGAGAECPTRPFRVTLEDDDGFRRDVTIPAAIGPRDAESQARERFPYETPLHAEEAVPESATFEEWMDWVGMSR